MILVLIMSLIVLTSCQMMPSTKPKPLSSCDGQVRELLAQMTLEEKIGQMNQLSSSNKPMIILNA